MTDTKRAILLFEYDDGTRRAFEFTQLSHAKLDHAGLPGHAVMSVGGHCRAVTQFGHIFGEPAPAAEITEGVIDVGTDS